MKSRVVIVVLSGPLSVGKSTISEAIARQRQHVHISVRDLLSRAAPAPLQSRGQRQRFGADLELRTGGEWLPDLIRPIVSHAPSGPTYIVDSVRTPAQAGALKRAFPRDCIHVHLSATRQTLETRFEERDSAPGEADTYEEATAHDIEQNETGLIAAADIVIATDGLSADETARRVEAAIDAFVQRTRADRRSNATSATEDPAKDNGE